MLADGVVGPGDALNLEKRRHCDGPNLLRRRNAVLWEFMVVARGKFPPTFVVRIICDDLGKTASRLPEWSPITPLRWWHLSKRWLTRFGTELSDISLRT